MHDDGLLFLGHCQPSEGFENVRLEENLTEEQKIQVREVIPRYVYGSTRNNEFRLSPRQIHYRGAHLMWTIQFRLRSGSPSKGYL